jgi:shikimate kinase
MNESGNIYLIGPMGSGKTAVGRQLAKELDMQFLDSDAEIEASTGVDIAYILEKECEASFRQRERECLSKLCAQQNIVLATGGGSILVEENRMTLERTGTVIYLRTSVERQLERTQHAHNRPLLLNGEPRKTLERLSELRNPLYERLAALSVDTGGRHVKAVVATIRNLLDKNGREPLKN